MKKIVCFLLCMCTLFSTVGCSNGGGIDSTKSQLYIGNQNAGLGTAWLEQVVKNFEQQYANTSFEPGKTGVEVFVTNRLEEYSQTSLTSTMPDNDIDLYYLDNIIPDAWISEGLISETTSAVQAKIYDEDGELSEISGKPAVQSIEDMMYDGVAQKYIVNNKYYGLPFFAETGGIIYDKDLFEEKSYYFEKSTYGPNGQITKLGDIGLKRNDENIGIGPDGIEGTTDDGLPETYTQFITLLDTMLIDNVIPFTWSVLGYQVRIAYTYIWANYEGADDFALNFSFAGEDSDFGDIDDTNAYQLRGQEGRKAALQLFYDLAKKSDYHSPNVDKSTQSHTEAEYEFVYSKKTNKRIAMLFEGSYWENEARSTFDFMEQTNPNDGYGKRNFGLLPVFKFTNIEEKNYGIKAQTTRENVLRGGNMSSYECISNASPRKEIAAKFIQFAHSASQLAVFTAHTDCIRPYTYTLTPAMKNTFTPFARSVYELLEDGAKLVPCVDSSPLKKANNGLFNTESCWNFRVVMNTTEYYNPYSVFAAKSPSYSIEEVFSAIKSYGSFTKDNWPSL